MHLVQTATRVRTSADQDRRILGRAQILPPIGKGLKPHQGTRRNVLRTAALLAMASLVLAGCTGGGSSAGTDEGPRVTEIEVNETAGGIEGTVVDEQIQPLVGATVGIKETGATTTTDEGGRFALGGLPEGTYTVLAQQ